MEAAQVVELGRDALWLAVLLGAPLLGIALIVGVLIGVIQAATSVNEMTLSFVPKLVFVLGGFALLASFMMTQLSDYFAFIFDSIRALG